MNSLRHSMRWIKLLLLSCVLTACDGSSSGDPTQGGASGSLAHSVASGLAMGVGMSAGHHIVNGAVNKWRERRLSPGVVRSYGGFRGRR